MKIKGAHDIPTIQSRKNAATLKSRKEISSEIARLEQARVRLRQELELWQSNQKRAEQQLEELEEYINRLRKAFDEVAANEPEPASSPSQTTVRKRNRPKAKEDDAEEWREIALEY